jgi:hypothetical protein
MVKKRASQKKHLEDVQSQDRVRERIRARLQRKVMAAAAAKQRQDLHFTSVNQKALVRLLGSSS